MHANTSPEGCSICVAIAKGIQIEYLQHRLMHFLFNSIPAAPRLVGRDSDAGHSTKKM
jgi:hypothetical protein